jgi:ribulose-5-phosphate 4-epimerase/fuculose-1-phosphate aldolase
LVHAAIYKARPDVISVVHTRSPSVIPFSLSKTPLRPLFQNAVFLATGVPVWDTPRGFGANDMLVRDTVIGKSLARTLGEEPVVLMRSHADVTVGPDIKIAVFPRLHTGH